METTDKGTLKIRMDNECRKFVVFNPINRTVWMRKCELIELFDVYTQTIDDCIQGIIKANVFDIVFITIEQPKLIRNIRV